MGEAAEDITEEETPTDLPKKRKGLCAALGEKIFTYNGKIYAYQMQTTLKQIFKHTGTVYG